MNENLAEKNPPLQIIFNMVFDMPLKISCNIIYAGVHYRYRMKHKALYRWEVLRACKSQNIQTISDYPVTLSFRFGFSKNALDSSNCSYMAKLIEDGLVQNEILKNDDIKFVKRIILESYKSEKDEIKLEVIYDEKDKQRVKDKRVTKSIPRTEQEELF